MAVWTHEIDLSDIWKTFRDKDLDHADTFIAYRTAVVYRLRWDDWAEDYGWAEAFEGTGNIVEFNQVLSDMYDEADMDRVWIKTF